MDAAKAAEFHSQIGQWWMREGERFTAWATTDWEGANWAVWYADQSYPDLVRLFGVERVSSHSTHSPEELSLLVDEAREAGAIRSDTGRLLGNVFRLGRTRVRDVMVPRARIFAVERTAPIEPLLEEVREQGYTRIPVCDGGIDRDFHTGADGRMDVFQRRNHRRSVIRM